MDCKCDNKTLCSPIGHCHSCDGWIKRNEKTLTANKDAGATVPYSDGLYAPHYLGGRARNGAHRDKGNVVHAVIPLERESSGCNFNKALCGKMPGMRSTGWEAIEQDVSCEKCKPLLKKGI